MRLFRLYIKSHTEAPDYEDEVEAMDEYNACKRFQERMGSVYDAVNDEYYDARADWSIGDLRRYVSEVPMCPQCGEEMRGYIVGDELVVTCNSCKYATSE